MSLARFINMQTVSDARGDLNVMEAQKNVPFDIKRVYCLTNMNDEARGFHAHKALRQVAVCLRGSCDFLLDDGTARETITLDAPTQGLVINGMIWREMRNFSDGCVIMVLADAHYDEDDYIRDYDAFKALART